MSILTQQDLELAQENEISEETLINQLEILKKGFLPIQVMRPCTLEDGIVKLDDPSIQESLEFFEQAKAKGRFSKFIPASGAASRMFKFIHAYMDDSDNVQPLSEDFAQLVDQLKKFPFADELDSKLQTKGSSLESVVSDKNWFLLSRMILGEEGLNYDHCPKALIPFHKSEQGVRNPIQEHLEFANKYLGGTEHPVRIHFTIDSQFIDEFYDVFEPYLETHKFEISHSIQKDSTQTLAIKEDGSLARDEHGNMLLRPGGHGALLENLSEIKGDLVYIQNIDNISHEKRHEEQIRYKKVLGGYLVKLEKEIHEHLASLQTLSPDQSLEQYYQFAQEVLGVEVTQEKMDLSFEDQVGHLKRLLDRPIRVCGMVKNEDEPGGGPFWCKGRIVSRQILEKAQINLDNKGQAKLLSKSTHFNPVDIVCSLRHADGNPFHLPNYRDADACFISEKSYRGETIHALEYPGLWNGSQAKWNTVFVEVPLMTFSPVKTVNDLLREAHQS